MSSRLLIISDNETPLRIDAFLESRLDVRVQTATWSSFVADPVNVAADLHVLCPPANIAPDAIASSLRAVTRNTPLFVVFSDSVEVETFGSIVALADDFLVWHASRRAECHERIARLLGSSETAATRERLIEGATFGKLIGEAETFTRAIDRIPPVARTNGTVLIVGETGTGKELCARAIHHLSPRRQRSFIPLDCGALPDQLLENELFGHVRGAFTDAHRDQPGLLSLADGGTLFLDEVDSLTPSAQTKLLRFLEDHTYRPLGSERFVRADVRVVAATNADLRQLVEHKRFRADLFFRLNVLRLRLPSLRERLEDIPLLARHFANRACDEAGIRRKRVLPSTIERLRRAPWPGNLRELFNVVHQAVVCFDGPDLLPSHLTLGDGDPEAEGPAASSPGSFREAKAFALLTFERSYVTALLRKHAGNVTRAALEAGTDRRAFGRLVKKHGIDRLAV